MTKLRWGILGTGNIARTLAEAIRASETSELTAVGSRTQEAAEKFGEEYEIPRRYGTYDGVLSDSNVDTVYISLPNHLHAEWTIKCAEAGKHILCEKPLAMNYPEAMAMVEAARTHGVFLMEAFMYRCAAQTQKIVEIIRGGALGDVRLIQASFSFDMGEKLDNIRQQNAVGGGGIMDVGCYTLSMARLIAGAAQARDFADPIELKGTAHIGKSSRVDEWAVAALRFPGDVLANLNCGNRVGTENVVRVYGSQGSLTIPNPWFPGRNAGDTSTLTLLRQGQAAEEITVPGGPGLYVAEVDTVAEHIGRGEAPSPAMTLDDSVGQQKALDAWRAQVGLVFDGENTTALQQPISRRPLQVRQPTMMRYGQIPGIDKAVSRLVIGSMVIHKDRLPFSFALLDNFFEIGGNAIDTAYVYGGGRAEPGVGAWINTRGLRDRVVLIAKGAATTQATPEIVTRELRESLDRLNVEYADLYLMHRDNPSVPVGEFVDCLHEHRQAGRIHAFGGSNWTPERLEAANDYAAERGILGFTASSPNFSLARWNEPMWADCVAASDAQSRAWYAKTHMPLLAWSSQASGLFTGRFHPGDQAGDVSRVWFNEGNWERLRRAEEVALRHGVTALQIALAYVLCQPLNIFALIGPQTLEETRTSARALEVELSPEELRYLDLGA